MVNFWSISMFLVLLEPVNRADSKYVFAVWVGSQVRAIYSVDPYVFPCDLAVQIDFFAFLACL